MKFLDQEEAENWIIHRGSNIEQCVKLQLNKPLFGFSTWSRGGLDTFNLGRFFWANLPLPDNTLFWITEKGPFNEQAEEFLFQKFLFGLGAKISPENNRAFLFNDNDHLEFVSIFSLSILFCWNFWIVNESAPFVMEHSHDVDARIHKSSNEILDRLQQMGIKNTLNEPTRQP